MEAFLPSSPIAPLTSGCLAVYLKEDKTLDIVLTFFI